MLNTQSNLNALPILRSKSRNSMNIKLGSSPKNRRNNETSLKRASKIPSKGHTRLIRNFPKIEVMDTLTKPKKSYSRNCETREFNTEGELKSTNRSLKRQSTKIKADVKKRIKYKVMKINNKIEYVGRMNNQLTLGEIISNLKTAESAHIIPSKEEQKSCGELKRNKGKENGSDSSKKSSAKSFTSNTSQHSNRNKERDRKIDQLLKRIERKFTNRKLVYLKKKAITDKRISRATRLIQTKHFTSNLNDLREIDIIPSSTMDNTLVNSIISSELSFQSETTNNADENKIETIKDLK